LYASFRRVERAARLRALGTLESLEASGELDLGILSGWYRVWRRRNSLRRQERGIEKGPLGGGPEASVEGKRV
jgi:hypothetical protein